MLYRYFQQWRKNPQWSFSCCLAFLLPLSDLEGEISGLAETNALNSQLQTGEAEIPTLSGALKDSGAIDVTFEGSEQDVKAVEVEGEICQDKQCGKRKGHQGTQTELFGLPVVVYKEKEEPQDAGSV